MSSFSRRDFLKVLGAAAAMPLAGALLPGSASSPASTGRAPNVLFVVFDTLSARHMSLYGYPRRTTPNIERFAGVSTVYHQHWAGGNFTTPGTASLLTGAYPWSHRAIHFYGHTLPAFESRNLFASLFSWQRDAYTHNNLAFGLLNQFRAHIENLTPPAALCLYDDRLADGLFPKDYGVAFYGEERIRGSRTSLHTSLLFSLLSKAHYTLVSRRLQAKFAAQFPLGLPDNYNDQIFLLEDAIDWIITRCSGLSSPFLGYYHLLPPHEPYTPRADFVGRFAGISPAAPDKPRHFFGGDTPPDEISAQRTHYDEYLAYVDAEFGRLYDALATAGRLEDTLIIFTSDHGQMFERGILGHITPVLYEPLLHIPLLIHFPGQTARQDVHLSTSAVDVLPTLMNLAAQPIPDWMEGQVLPGAAAQSASYDASRPVFALDAKENAKGAPLTVATLAVRQGEYKLIHYFGYAGLDERVELYDLKNDPEELRDLSALKPALVSDLLQVIAASQRPPYTPPSP
ncbi:MAG: choline-sulfatase [Anaerolineales bacterium]